MKRTLYIIYFNISLLCVLLVGTELLGQVGYYLVKRHPLQSDNYTANAHRQFFEFHPYLAGRPKRDTSVKKGNVIITATDIHTRWTGADLQNQHASRIAVLGGSSTFGTKVTDSESWPAILQTYLGNEYSVINYGVPGYSTAENIIQLALTVPEERPELVIVYAGWNDIRNYHNADIGADYFGHGMKQYDNLGLPLGKTESAFDTIAKASAIFSFAQYARTRMNPKAINSVQPLDTPDPFVDKIYRRNLGTLRTLAEHFGAQVLFVPQVLNVSEFQGKTGSRWWSPNIEDDALPKLLDRFNLAMNEVCEPGDTKCSVLTGIGVQNWEPADFADDGHFSKVGGEKFAKLIAERVSQMMGDRRR